MARYRRRKPAKIHNGKLSSKKLNLKQKALKKLAAKNKAINKNKSQINQLPGVSQNEFIKVPTDDGGGTMLRGMCVGLGGLGDGSICAGPIPEPCENIWIPEICDACETCEWLDDVEGSSPWQEQDILGHPDPNDPTSWTIMGGNSTCYCACNQNPVGAPEDIWIMTPPEPNACETTTVLSGTNDIVPLYDTQAACEAVSCGDGCTCSWVNGVCRDMTHHYIPGSYYGMPLLCAEGLPLEQGSSTGFSGQWPSVPGHPEIHYGVGTDGMSWPDDTYHACVNICEQWVVNGYITSNIGTIGPWNGYDPSVTGCWNFRATCNIDWTNTWLMPTSQYGLN